MTGAVTRAAPGRSTAIASEFRADQALPYIGAAGFAISAVLTRLPLAGKYLFDWDSVQFALGMSRFDLAAHRPHPPGYLGYIVLGKAVAALFDLDANRALALLSIGAEALTVAGIFLLARRLFGGFAGMAAALLLLTSPLYWLYGETALTYGLEPGLALLGFWPPLQLMIGSPGAASKRTIMVSEVPEVPKKSCPPPG